MTHRQGAVLGGRYTLTERIAIGGMGEVWAATDTVLGRVVAVKVLRTDNAAALLARFRDEARHTAALSHSGIARVHDYGEDGSDAFLVMELIPGEPLSAVLSREGKLPVTVALSYLAQTAEAIAAAHAIGVVHRDIKPGNLMILPDGTVKVTDFGIARAVDATSMTAVGQVIGTAQYMSPEQATGLSATASSDIYSLGVVGYEMLAGKLPFTGESPVALALAHVHQPVPELPHSVPADVRSLIIRSLAKDPASRPSTAEAFAIEARELQRRLLPAPLDAAAAALPATEVIDDAESSATSVMPAGFAVAGAAQILDRDFVRSVRSRRRLIASTIVLVAALVVGLALLRSGKDQDQTGGLLSTSPAATGNDSTTSTTQSTTPPTVAALVPTTAATVLVDPDVLIGLTKADATARLVALGLQVVEKKSTGSGQASKDTVVGVEPSGQVPPGSTITLLVGRKK